MKAANISVKRAVSSQPPGSVAKDASVFRRGSVIARRVIKKKKRTLFVVGVALGAAMVLAGSAVVSETRKKELEGLPCNCDSDSTARVLSLQWPHYQ